MARINITRTHTLGLQSARVAADRVADELRAEHGVRAHWEENRLLVRGVGVKGELAVSEDHVFVNVRLGLTMRLFRHALEREIIDQLDAHLAAAS